VRAGWSGVKLAGSLERPLSEPVSVSELEFTRKGSKRLKPGVVFLTENDRE
jgi:hypothetical protein